MLIDEFGQRVEKKMLDRKIIFFGASTRNQKVIDEFGIQKQVLFFVDSDERKQGEKLGDYVVKSTNALVGKKDCVIVSVLVEYAEEVLECVKRYNIQCLFYLAEQFDIEKVNKSNLEILDLNAKYKYIHIIPSQKFFKMFYEMIEIEERWDISEHLFIIANCLTKNTDIYGIFQTVEIKNRKNHNVLVFDEIHIISNFALKNVNCNMIYKGEQIQRIFISAEKIFLHSMFFKQSMKKLLNWWADRFGNKMIWLSWGRDSKMENDHLVVDILRKVGGAYSAAIQVEEIWRNYGIRAKIINVAGYAYIPNIEISVKDCKEKGCKYILLGHSAAQHINHTFGLDLLYRWRNENIKIYCPLSYSRSPQSYQNDVVAKGKEMFAEKFIPIFDYMELNQYYVFLKNIDVAVMPMTTMSGATTLTYLSSNNKKIYLRHELIGSYKELGIYSEDIELIKKQSFEQFLKNENHDTINQNNVVVELWTKILSDEIGD